MKQVAGITAVLFILISLSCSNSKQNNETGQNFGCQPEFAWLDETLPVEERVELLLGELTLYEKISQLWYDNPAISRLNIPEYNWWNEALHGVARSARATVFPQTIGLAATFDDELIERMAVAISDESRAIYNEMVKQGKAFQQFKGLTYWSPNVNIFRDPRWGRGQETYGEDPFLTGRMGVAFIRGMQGRDSLKLKVATCAKHFAVHSGPEGERHGFNAKANLKDLQETYLPAFKACVDANVEAIMCAYNRTNDEPCCGSSFLLNDILKKQWGFNGHIVSDCGAISDFQWGHHYTDSLVESVVLALESGFNLNCGQSYRSIDKAIKAGLVDEELVNQRLRPLLRTKFKLGFFDAPESSPWANIQIDVVNCEKHQSLAYETAVKSMVLLQNKNNVLPLSNDMDFLYMVGPMGSNTQSLVGNYNGLSPNFTTLVEGITRKVSPTTRIEYRPGVLLNTPNSNPIDWYSVQSREADVTIAMLGFTSTLEGEEGEAIASSTHGDNPTMKLPDSQMDLLRRLKNDKNPVVAVICAGSPVDLTEVLDLVDAVIYLWYPGEAGGDALADILFGNISPSGKLPLTFPKGVRQLPPFNDYSMKGRTYKYMKENPLFPFGFGLTYGDVKIVSVKTNTVSDNKLYVEALVQNNSDVPTEEVLQLYSSLKQAPVDVAVAELKDFKRIKLAGKEKLRVSFVLDNKQFFYYKQDGNKIMYNGEVEIYAGLSAPMPEKGTRDLSNQKVKMFVTQEKESEN